MCPVTVLVLKQQDRPQQTTLKVLPGWFVFGQLRHLVVQEDAQRKPYSFVVGTISRFSSVAAALKHIHPGTAAGQQPPGGGDTLGTSEPRA